MTNKTKSVISGVGSFVLEGFRRSHFKDVDAAFEDGVFDGIYRAIAALSEVGIEDERIISLIAKHWDLRFSDAQTIVKENRDTSNK